LESGDKIGAPLGAQEKLPTGAIRLLIGPDLADPAARDRAFVLLPALPGRSAEICKAISD
jgi:hypothetical protein